MSDNDLTMTDLGKIICKECGREGLAHATYYGRGSVEYSLACPRCDWEQKGVFGSLREAVAAYVQWAAEPPAEPTPLTIAAAAAKNGNFEAAGYYVALAQAEALTRIAEVLETMLDEAGAASTRATLAESARIWGS